jgi:hypothetical protein
MIDLHPAPVPELSQEWVVSHQAALVEALSQRRRKPMKWVAVAGATGVAASVSTFALLGGSTQSAFAGWSATPTAPTSGQLGNVNSVCRELLSQAQQVPPSNKGAPPDAASLVPELSDVRGPYTVTVFGNGSPGGVLCISAPSATSIRWIMGSGAPVGSGAIVVDQMSILDRDGQPYTLVEGRTGGGVTGVTLSLGDGSTVTASSGNGVFVAWWPGSQSVTSAILSTATGESTQTLNLPGPVVPPAGTKSSPLSPGTQSSSPSSGTQSSSVVCLVRCPPTP